MYPQHECLRCQYRWVGRKHTPKSCAKCHSPYWNLPRRKLLSKDEVKHLDISSLQGLLEPKKVVKETVEEEVPANNYKYDFSDI